MGFSSTLNTALTGIRAAETQVDVIGNNLANSQTVGFKASQTVFATQFLQTQGLGSAPTSGSGGTNPRQTGLGTQVAEITPDFTQGTIEVSSSPSDLAIQGRGFFIVQGSFGEQLYTRNGIFKTNSENELVTVTGNRLMGFGVDENYQLRTTELQALAVPLGSKSVAQATQNVYLEGTFTPLGDVADTAEVIESAVLGDAAVPRPDTSSVAIATAAKPDSSAIAPSVLEGAGGTHPEGAVYRYRIAYVDSSGTESTISDSFQVTVNGSNGLADQTVRLSNLPSSSLYQSVNIYRTEPGGSDFYLLDNVAMGTTTYDDTNAVPLDLTQPLDSTNINGNYSYLITYYREGEGDSRPSPLLGPQSVVNGRIQLRNLPTPPVPPADGGFPAYDRIRIWRNTTSDSSTYHLVDTIDPGVSYTDSKTDAEIAVNAVLDMDGPKADSNTLLVNVLRRDELDYEQAFREGTMLFTGRKGGRTLEAKGFTITSTTTVQDLIDFMQDAMGIQKAIDDPQNPIPSSLSTVPGYTTFAPGGSIQNGKIRLVSNNGVDNALSVGLSAFQLTDSDGDLVAPDLGFGSIQTAKGQSAVAEFVVYDSLGTPLNVRVTAVLEERTGSQTVYRWFADSSDNDALSGSDISVGTGLVRFDGQGNLLQVTNTTVAIERRNVPAASPLQFNLDFSQISGLATSRSTLAASRQDGSAPGTLTGFSIGEDGLVRGAFSNGVTRTLGQIRMARFTNPAGLEQRGQNMFSQGPNSGLPVVGNPGENGNGSIIAGAVELSNTDIGKNLIDLVLATSHYRGNARVISTSQELLDELLNLRR